MRALEALPPGHPSSPYQADGSRRPAEPSLRSLELPLPDEWSEAWGTGTSDRDKSFGEWGNSSDWAINELERNSGANAADGAAAGHGKDAGGRTGDAGERYEDSAKREGDGNTGREDRNEGAAGDGRSSGPDSSTDRAAGTTDGRDSAARQLTEQDRSQAGESSSDESVPAVRAKQSTADNTAGRAHADNAQTADAAPPPEGTHRSYWTEVPRFKDMWNDHESAWPKEAQPAAKIDRSGDPPGSWRSDSNLFLGPDTHARAKDAIDRSRDAEPYITNDLRTVVDESPASAELVGLEFRYKGEDRLKEKVAQALERRPDATPEETVQNINDTIRYTVRLNPDDYTNGHRFVTEGLKGHGYELYYQENHWDDPEYKGINTRWLTPDGQKFELQFHTPESFHAKQEVTHKAYERIRNPLTPEDERPALEAFQAEVSSWIPVPADVLSIPSFPKKGP